MASVAAERLGSKVGGVIGGLPSTAVVAFGFIGWTQGAQQVYDATTAFPLAFAVNAFYLVAYAALSPRGLWAGIGAALLTWLSGEALILWLDIQKHLGFDGRLDRGPGRRLPGAGARARGALSRTDQDPVHGRADAGAGGLCRGHRRAGRTGEPGGRPHLGQHLAAFPALYTSTLILVSRSAGVAFSRSLTTPLMVSSVVNVTVFVLALRFVVLHLPLGGALAAAYGVSMVSAYGTYWFIKRYVR